VRPIRLPMPPFPTHQTPDSRLPSNQSSKQAINQSITQSPISLRLRCKALFSPSRANLHQPPSHHITPDQGQRRFVLYATKDHTNYTTQSVLINNQTQSYIPCCCHRGQAATQKRALQHCNCLRSGFIPCTLIPAAALLRFFNIFIFIFIFIFQLHCPPSLSPSLLANRSRAPLTLCWPPRGCTALLRFS
jgi:hypothetical protein